MITTPPFAQTENARYPQLAPTTLDQYLTAAHQATASV